MGDLSEVIPGDFWDSDHSHPVAKNVGELIDILSQLPGDLPIRQGFGMGCEVIVFNVSENPFVEFEEVS